MKNNIRIEITKKQDNNDCARGKITIGQFSEFFEVALDSWHVEDYVNQWQAGLERLEMYKKSCLVASVNNPHKRPYINWWLLYKENGKICVQNQIIIEDIYQEVIGDQPFTLDTCYDFIPPREMHDEDGEEIAEWFVGEE